MKRWMKWAIAAVVVALLAAGVLRTLSARKAQQAAVAEQSANRTPPALEIRPEDVVAWTQQELQQVQSISGSLRAVQSAWVKARTAGDLQDLQVREGDSVSAGQVLARVDATDARARLRQAQAQALATQAQVDIAQRTFDNNQALVTQGFISKTGLETATSSLSAAQATHRAALAAVDQINKSLEDTVLRAPISGQVAQRLAQTGERVGIDARVLEIVDLKQLELEASLSAADAMSVRVGQVAQLRMEGVGDPLPAKVVRISPTASAGSRAVMVYLSVPAREGLRQGLFAQGELVIGQVKAPALPLAAIRTDKPQPYVQLIAQDQVMHQTVQLGPRGMKGQDTMVVVTGLSEGARVLAGNVGLLRAGTPIKMIKGAP
ncbi:MAG: hypothetical protein RLZZ591_2224 [Pseudomonadota bacterium]|jgi:RND family efflux transporter MFP subunit